MRIPRVSSRPARPRARLAIAWPAALLMLALATAAACTVAPNRLNDHPYDNLPRSHGEAGW